MDENPYKSPLANQARRPAEQPPLVPLWRRIVSIPLIIFGVLLLLSCVGNIFVGSRIGFSREPFILAIVIDALFGVPMLWGGLWLRRGRIRL